jgi:MFS family permease
MKYSNKTILWVLTLMNILNFIDRGIIPGATNEFTSFIEDSGIHHNESVYLGLLQSAFIVGYAIASGIFGHMVHYFAPFRICLIGMTIWVIAVALSGLSFYSRQYVFLFLSRMLSGVAEASFQCSIPPWISKYSTSEEKGTWMSIFFTAIPVGTAIGYAYSAALAESIGWQFSFFFEGATMLLFFPFLIKIAPHFPCESHPMSRGSKDSNGPSLANVVTAEHEIPSILDEFKALFGSSVYVLVVAGYAMQTAAVIGVSTFGSAFLMGLGYFNTETESSTIFGILVSIAGIIATPFGGILLDKLAARHMELSDSGKHDYKRAPTTNTGGPVSPIDKIEREIRAINNSTNENDDNDDDDDDEEIILPTIDADKERATLHSALIVITMVSIFGGIFLCLDYLIYNKVLFIMMIGIGCFFIFMSYSGITMAIMLAVPVHNRAFAMGMSTLCIHVFGDVPSPIITGLIKDRLAPACAGGSTTSDSVATSEACREEGQGLRLTMLILTCLLVLTVIFFAVAWVEELRLFRKSLVVDSQKIRLLQSDIFESCDTEDEEAPRRLRNRSDSPPGQLGSAGQVANLRRPSSKEPRPSASKNILAPKSLVNPLDQEGLFVGNPMNAGDAQINSSPSRHSSRSNGTIGSPSSPAPMSISTNGRDSFSEIISQSAPVIAPASVGLSEATMSLLDSALDDGTEETRIFSTDSLGTAKDDLKPTASGRPDGLDEYDLVS